ncbi:MAG: biopolymer transporter ExbD [Planctomycetota bacterium]
MEMHKYVKQDAHVDMDMTPMIDIVFLLIIFFMIVTELSNLEIEEVVLPLADQAKVVELQPGSREIKVNVVVRDRGTGAGEIIIAGEAMNRKRLTQFLKTEAEIFPGREDNPSTPGQKDSLLEVLIRIDQGAQSKYIQDIFSACKDAKIFKVRFAALSQSAGTPVWDTEK